MRNTYGNFIGIFVALSIALISFSGWVTHVISCIEHEQWGFLIAGAIAVPIGTVHGIGIWFGVW